MEEEKNMEVVSLSNFEDDDCICTSWQPESKRIKLHKRNESVNIKREDNDEINAMAAKIAEDNRLKMALAQKLNARNMNKMQIRRNVQTSLQSKDKGKFGWSKLTNGFIPFIFRGDERYCSVKMLETKYMPDIHKYLNTNILTCPSIISHYMLHEEASLMNEINIKHSDKSFGSDLFTTKDILITLHDTIEYYNFFKFASLKISNPLCKIIQPRCGFVHIDKITVPYCVKNNQKLIPLFFFDGDDIKLTPHILNSWDMAYLKFCCIMLKLKSNIFEKDQKAIYLEDIKRFLPKDTIIDEEPWPNSHNVPKVQTILVQKSDQIVNKTAQPQPNDKSVLRLTKPPGIQRTMVHGMYTHVYLGKNNIVRNNPMPKIDLEHSQEITIKDNQSDNVQIFDQKIKDAKKILIQRKLSNPIPQKEKTENLPSQKVENNEETDILNQKSQNEQNNEIFKQNTQNDAKKEILKQNSTRKNAQTIIIQTSRQFYVQIRDFNVRNNGSLFFKIQKAYVVDTMVPCINWKPYDFTSLLMCLNDLVQHLIPNLTVEKCENILRLYNVYLYLPNMEMRKVLLEGKKISKIDETISLILVSDVITYISRLRYVD